MLPPPPLPPSYLQGDSVATLPFLVTSGTSGTSKIKIKQEPKDEFLADTAGNKGNEETGILKKRKYNDIWEENDTEGTCGIEGNEDSFGLEDDTEGNESTEGNEGNEGNEGRTKSKKSHLTLAERQKHRQNKLLKKTLKLIKEADIKTERMSKRLDKHCKKWGASVEPLLRSSLSSPISPLVSSLSTTTPATITTTSTTMTLSMTTNNAIVNHPMIDLSLLPYGDTIPLRQPLQVPFDCISFDGKYMLSCLVMTDRRDVPTICRFVRTPPESAELLMGVAGMKNPQDAYLSPSLGAAAKRCYLKSANGWLNWYVVVIYQGRAYRVPLDRFRKNKQGPGFVKRPGVNYTEEEFTQMCDMAFKLHPSTTEVYCKKFFERVANMGAHSDRHIVPHFLESFLRVIPTVINPNPTTPATYPGKQLFLNPVTPTSIPTFVHFST
jgi:hypothetical protein